MESKEIIFDSRVFSVEAVKNAAYRLSNTLDCEIRLEEHQIICTARPLSASSSEAIEDALRRLRREVIDHDLRLRIRTDTEATRNLILALAFSRTGIIPSE